MSKTLRVAALCVSFLVGTVSAAAEQWTYPQTEAELDAAYQALAYMSEPGRYELAVSRSTVDLPDGQYLLRGTDAQRYEFLVNGSQFPETEAVILNSDETERVVFEYVDSGYVSDDDWSALDADALLEDVIAGTEAGNKERAANGVSPLYVVGWLERPHFDPERKIAFWSLKLRDAGSGEIVNTVAIRLSRHGYHRITWVGDPTGYAGTPPILEASLGGHDYDVGYRYADYVDGDKLAGFGIASLVAASAGGTNFGKGVLATIMAAIVLFAKKAWFLVFAALGGLGIALKKMLPSRKGSAG